MAPLESNPFPDTRPAFFRAFERAEGFRAAAVADPTRYARR
jgi:hypothetical protein